MDTQQITQQIVAHKDNISLEAQAATQSKFCDTWPQVQVGLQLLAGLVKNPIVKLVISIVSGAGDAVVQNICGQPAEAIK